MGRARHSRWLISFLLFLPEKSFPLSPSLSPTLAFGALSIPLTSPLFFLLLHFANLSTPHSVPCLLNLLFLLLWRIQCRGEREREQEAQSKSFLRGVVPLSLSLSLSLLLDDFFLVFVICSLSSERETGAHCDCRRFLVIFFHCLHDGLAEKFFAFDW